MFLGRRSSQYTAWTDKQLMLAHQHSDDDSTEALIEYALRNINPEGTRGLTHSNQCLIGVCCVHILCCIIYRLSTPDHPELGS